LNQVPPNRIFLIFLTGCFSTLLLSSSIFVGLLSTNTYASIYSLQRALASQEDGDQEVPSQEEEQTEEQEVPSQEEEPPATIAPGEPHPQQKEICGDGIDNNADGSVDENCPSNPQSPEQGICMVEGCPGQEEVCNDGLDNNADGSVDENCPSNPQSPEPDQSAVINQLEASKSSPEAFSNTLNNLEAQGKIPAGATQGFESFLEAIKEIVAAPETTVLSAESGLEGQSAEEFKQNAELAALDIEKKGGFPVGTTEGFKALLDGLPGAEYKLCNTLSKDQNTGILPGDCGGIENPSTTTTPTSELPEGSTPDLPDFGAGEEPPVTPEVQYIGPLGYLIFEIGLQILTSTLDDTPTLKGDRGADIDLGPIPDRTIPK
jgi:hypothetical protein